MDIPDFTGGATLADLQAVFLLNYESAYFALTGNTRVVQPAQAEMLLINSGAYMIFLQLLRVQSAALQNLAAFAIYPALDEICRPFGVVRELPQAAKTTVQFQLNTGHGALVIPAGLRVQSNDGLATFFLWSPITVGSGVDVISGICICDTPGVGGNGYAIDAVTVILDPQAYLAAVYNQDITAGGSDAETDAGMRSRLNVASGAFSCAGPDDAYISIAKSASPLILDVKVNNGGGGVVNLYVLVAGGTTAPEILAAVEAACNPKTVRPTSDTVTAFAPTVISYAVQIDITVNGSVADPTALTAACQAAVQLETDTNGALLGIDTIKSKLEALAYLPGVYKATINSPAADIIVDESEVGICTGVVVTLIGFNYER